MISESLIVGYDGWIHSVNALNTYEANCFPCIGLFVAAVVDEGDIPSWHLLFSNEIQTAGIGLCSGQMLSMWAGCVIVQN
jgi:hypothetical protein